MTGDAPFEDPAHPPDLAAAALAGGAVEQLTVPLVGDVE